MNNFIWCLKFLFSVKGRISQTEKANYIWLIFLTWIIVSILFVAIIFLAILLKVKWLFAITHLMAIPFNWPILAIKIKRAHDRNISVSGPFEMLFRIPIHLKDRHYFNALLVILYTPIMVLTFMYFMHSIRHELSRDGSVQGAERFGPPPTFSDYDGPDADFRTKTNPEHIVGNPSDVYVSIKIIYDTLSNQAKSHTNSHANQNTNLRNPIYR